MREPIPGPPHPERWRDDMNPDFMAGQNFAEAGAEREESRVNAYDAQAAHDRCRWLKDGDLYVPKSEVDFELWNRLTERPAA